jgi:hypothetical protein
MSVNNNPALTIHQLAQNANITQNQPFIVSWTVTDTAGAEPIDAPVIVVDLTSTCGDPNLTLCLKPGDQTIASLVQALQSALLPVATELGSYNLMLAGPNVIAGPVSSGYSSIRIGIWIEDFSFPVIAANPNNGSPLPTLPDKGAIAGLAMVPFSVPVPTQGHSNVCGVHSGGWIAKAGERSAALRAGVLGAAERGDQFHPGHQ